jgi:hypothetical protein
MTDLELAKQTFRSGLFAFVLVRDGQVIGSGVDHGVAELLAAVERLGDDVRGAALADKVVGKAVALIVAHAGIEQVYTPVASRPAIEFFAARRIPLHAEAFIPTVLNRRGDGPCPLEQLTMELDDAAAGIAKLREFLDRRRAGSGSALVRARA